MPTLNIRWIDDGSTPQTVIKKASSVDGGRTWTGQAVIYNTNVNPVPAGFAVGVPIIDIDVGVPTQKGYVIELPTSGSSTNEQLVYVPSDSSPTPVAIDTTNRPSPPSAFGTQRNFWVDKNGVLWIVAESAVLHTTVVYKSTDGITWTLMDSAHAIAVAVFGNYYWDVQNSTKIQFIVADGSGFMALQEFDTATGLYTSVHGSNVALGTGWSLGVLAVNQGIVAVQYAAASAPFKASLAIWNGSSWNNVGQISNDTTLTCMEMDSNGTSYMVHGLVGAGNNPAMNLSVYSALGVHIGSDVAFPFGSADGDLTGSPNACVQQPYVNAPDGNVVIPTRVFSNSGELNGAVFLCPIGAASLSSPFFVQNASISQFYGGQVGAMGGLITGATIQMRFGGVQRFPTGR